MTFNSNLLGHLKEPLHSCASGHDLAAKHQFEPAPEEVTMEFICTQLTADPNVNIAMLFHYGPAYLQCPELDIEKHRDPLAFGEACLQTPEGKKKAFSALLLQQERSAKKICNLANLKEYNSTLFDNCPDGLVVSTSEGIIVDVNRTFIRMCGQPKDKLLGIEGHTLVTSDYRDSVKKVIGDTVKNGNSRFKGRLKLPGNHDLPIRVALQTFQYHGETLLFSVVREFSNLDEKIWQFEKYNRSLAYAFQQASDSFLTLSDSGLILETNGAFYETLGTPPDADIESRIDDFIARESLSVFRRSLATVATTGYVSFSCIMQKVDGSTLPARMTMLRFQREERQAYRCIIQRTDTWESLQ